MGIKKLLKTIKFHIRDLFSVDLPKGTTEFDLFCTGIFEDYKIPAEPSYVQAIATMILHLGPTTSRSHRTFFVQSIKKAMANQIAYAAIDQIRESHRKEEVTPSAEVVSLPTVDGKTHEIKA